MREHTRNQRRMYRIHKQDEKILEQELIISSLQTQLQQKENIIKEVREYIKEHTLYDDKFPMLPGDIKELLEILDRSEK